MNSAGRWEGVAGDGGTNSGNGVPRGRRFTCFFARFVVLVPLVAVGGALIDFGINLAIATAAFWFIRIDTLRWVVMSLEQEFTRYPISIYTRGVRFILAFVFPFAFMNYFPATFLLHKTETGLSLSPQVGTFNHTTQDLVLCQKGVQGFFQWDASMSKFGDVRGPEPVAGHQKAHRVEGCV